MTDDDRVSAVDLLAPEVEEELAQALRAAWAPDELDAGLNEALIAQALEDPFAEASPDEIAESGRLRAALEGDGDHPDAALARALAAALAPGELDPARAEQLGRKALPSSPPAPRRGAVIYVAFGAAAAVAALAASVAMVVGRLDAQAPSAAEVAARAQELAVSRSTAPMFQGKFDAADTTARIDRIALARARDLRSNRYALWGVR